MMLVLVHVRSLVKMDTVYYKGHIVLYKRQTEIHAPRMKMDFK